MAKRLTTEEFILRAKKVHGGKYDYSKVKYINSKTKVVIVCSKHGSFWQIPNSHLLGFGCKGCCNDNMSELYRNTPENFIKEAQKFHGDKYDYSKIEYINSKTKIDIQCPIHGSFSQTPITHSRGVGCPKCGRENATDKTKSNTVNFIVAAIKIHGDTYDYSETKYFRAQQKVKIICPDHGSFNQLACAHLSGNGCRLCAYNKNALRKASTTNQFIKKAQKTHVNKYSYSLVSYQQNKKHVQIICYEHGIFRQRPNDHLNGYGCPKCALRVPHEKAHLYAIYDSDKNPTYIGKTVGSLDTRLMQHLNRPSPKVGKWLQRIDYTPKIKMLVSDVHIDDIDEMEQFFIQEFSTEYQLLNVIHNC